MKLACKTIKHYKQTDNDHFSWQTNRHTLHHYIFISNGCQTLCGFNHFSVIMFRAALNSCQSYWLQYSNWGSLSSRAEVEDFFKRMDRDYDGRLSFGEFMGEETPLEKVNVIFVGQTSVFISISTKVGLLNKTMQVFKSMDKDGSGTITKEEFLKICKNLSKEQVK